MQRTRRRTSGLFSDDSRVEANVQIEPFPLVLRGYSLVREARIVAEELEWFLVVHCWEEVEEG
jgi:hypothetical protein